MFPLTVSAKQLSIGLLITVAASAATTRYFFPIVNEKIVEHETVKNNIVTVVKTVKEPNGAVETISTTTDHTIKLESQTTTIATLKPQWLVGGGMGYDIHSLTPSYQIEINRRIIGPVLVGLSGSTDGAVRLNVLVEF